MQLNLRLMPSLIALSIVLHFYLVIHLSYFAAHESSVFALSMLMLSLVASCCMGWFQLGINESGEIQRPQLRSKLHGSPTLNSADILAVKEFLTVVERQANLEAESSLAATLETAVVPKKPASVSAAQDLFRRLSVRLTKLLTYSRENANFAAANKLDWKKTKLLSGLSQVRQNHDKLQNTCKSIHAAHDTMLRLLDSNLKSDLILADKISRVDSHLLAAVDPAQGAIQSFEQLQSNLAAYREDLCIVTRNLAGLTQRIESIEQMTESSISNCRSLENLISRLDTRLCRSLVDVECKELCGELKLTVQKITSDSSEIKQYGHDLTADVDRSLHSIHRSEKNTDTLLNLATACDGLYKDCISQSKFSRSELALLNRELEILSKRITEVKELGDSSSQIYAGLDPLLTQVGHSNVAIAENASELSSHAAKLSQLLTKQYYELSHCEKMSSDSQRYFSHLNQDLETLYVQTVQENVKSSPIYHQLMSQSLADFNAHLAETRACLQRLEEQSLQSNIPATTAQGFAGFFDQEALPADFSLSNRKGSG